MKFYQLFARSMLLVTLPVLALHSQTEEIRHYPTEIQKEEIYDDLFFSYDDLLDLLEELEEGDLEERCSVEELARINQFMVLLARQGIQQDDSEETSILENDVQELLNPESAESDFGYWYSLDGGKDFIIISESGHVFLCKSWIKKKCEQVKKFVKKHKKAILIGAAVVVAVTVVVCAVSMATTAAATAAGAAAADSGSNRGEGRSEDTKHEAGIAVLEAVPMLTTAMESSHLMAALDEQVSSFKELVGQDEVFLSVAHPQSDTEGSLGEKARYYGSFLAHEALDGISQLGSIFPHLQQEIMNLNEIIHKSANSIGTVGYSREGVLHRPDSLDPLQRYQNLITAGHESIDKLFSTEHADYFRWKNSEDAQAAKEKFTVGVLPPPVLAPTCPQGRIPITMVSSVRGWKVGEPITNRTIFGTVPKWNTVRRRYWKNRAEWAKSNSSHKYGDENIPRMEKGLAPQRFNSRTAEFESMELHHDPAQRDGGLFDFIEVWPNEHAAVDPNRFVGY